MNYISSIDQDIFFRKLFAFLVSLSIIGAHIFVGDSPSGKAVDFDSTIRGFESLIPSQLYF